MKDRIRAFLYELSFGMLFKPKKKYGIYLFINGVPVAQLAETYDEQYMENATVKKACTKITDNIYASLNDFPAIDSMMNELNIPLESDNEQD